MDAKIREIVFTPLSAGTLSAIVSDFRIELPTGNIEVPALLTGDDERFLFTLHFMQPVPPADLGNLRKQFVTQADQLTISGQINGEIAFRCRDIFPPSGLTTRSRGTSTITMRSSRMELIAEGSDTLDSREMRARLKMEERAAREHVSFDAHVIFHGPKLRIRDSGTEITRKNDFLGEAASSSADTHVFAGGGYEGALIQNKDELHLHLRSTEQDAALDAASPSELVDHVAQSVAFAFGFHPWPVYREVRIDHRVKERWLSPHLNLSQTFLAPVSESLWSTYHGQRSSPLYSIVPTVAAGLSRMDPTERKRTETLLWIVRSSDLSAMPESTKLLMLCSALDGLLQLIAGAADGSKRLKTNSLWRKASDQLGLSWDKWTEGIFEMRGKYRDTLAHGRLWIPEERPIDQHFTDYARLGCAFMTLIAARWGYDGPMIADPLEPRKVIIRDIKG